MPVISVLTTGTSIMLRLVSSVWLTAWQAK